MWRTSVIHKLFEEQVHKSPDAVAVALGDQQLSYRELNTAANHLANHLQTLGVGPEVLVAICIDRSLEMVIGILGILKAGGAYVPLDPEYPKARLELMLEDAKPSVLLTRRHLVGHLPAQAAQVVLLNGDWPAISKCSKENPQSRSAPEHLAYVIYTSGSTGKPKGVMITHGNLGHYVQTVRVPIGIAASDRYLHTASISFSSSVRQLMLPLSQGATVVIATSDQVRDPLALFENVKRSRVTIMDVVPSYWRTCIQALSSQRPELRNKLLDNQLRRILSASESLLSDVPRDWKFGLKHKAKLLNMYGQTETTGIVSIYPISPRKKDPLKVIPIGRPIGNTQIHLLDSRLRPVAIGAPGEIYVGGAGVGRGYLNNHELTAERFIPDPYSAEPGACLYKTGDLGRHLPTGDIEFLGRMDSQVKIRGHRVELSEVEAALREHPGIHDVALVPKKDESRNDRIVAYVIPEKACAPFIAGKERYRLPNHMAVVQQNKHETDFLYRQIFIDQTNFRNGITVRDGDCVFDVGANIGLFTLFVQQVRDNITVYAFEPILNIFEDLSANVSLYGKRTKLFQCGIADEAKEVSFTYYPNSSTQSGRYANTEEERQVLKTVIANQKKNSGANWAPYLDELAKERVAGKPVICRLRTLSDIIDEHKVERIDLLKIDAEKSELDILAGIRDGHWERIRQIVIEAHDTGGALEKLTALLRRHHYAVVAEEDEYIKGSGLYNVYATREALKEPSTSRKSGEPSYSIPFVPETILTPGGLRHYLLAKLPEYMVPSTFVMMDVFPLLPNGKLDRAALPPPVQDGPIQAGSFTALRSPVEEALAAIWSEILAVSHVGSDDNFFDLGGNSLSAIQVIARARAAFHAEIPMRTLIAHPTLAEMAAVLAEYLSHRPEPQELDRVLADLEQLSEEEAQRLLAEESDTPKS